METEIEQEECDAKWNIRVRGSGFGMGIRVQVRNGDQVRGT